MSAAIYNCKGQYFKEIVNPIGMLQEEDRTIIYEMFEKILKAFHPICSKHFSDRSNFFNYSYLLFKMLEVIKFQRLEQIKKSIDLVQTHFNSFNKNYEINILNVIKKYLNVDTFDTTITYSGFKYKTKLEYNDSMWQYFCEKLDYPFIPSKVQETGCITI